MRKIIYGILLSIFSAGLAFGQSTIYSTNFGIGTTLPSGWSVQSGTQITVSTASSSSGYTGASGNSNLLFSNNQASTLQRIVFNGVSTVGFTNIQISYGAIRTTGLPAFPTVTLEWSSDGTNWNNVSLGTPTGSWTLRGPFTLPVAAEGKANIQLRFNYTIAATNATKTFRIDDFMVLGTGGAPVTYYSKSSGDLDLLSTWGTNTNGTGTSPLNFTADNQTFNITNNATPTLGNNWAVTGANSTILVKNGSNFTIPSAFTVTGTVDVESNATLTLDDVLTLPTFGTLDNNSTLAFANYINADLVIPAGTYGNITVSNGYPGMTGDVIINGVLNISGAGDAFQIADHTLTLNGTISGPGGLYGNDGSFTTSAMVINGTGSLGTLNFYSGGESLTQLTMNRPSSGTATLSTALTITSSLTLTNGTLILNGQILTLDDASFNVTNGNIRGDATANITVSGSGSSTGGTLVMDQSNVAGGTNTLNALIANRTLSLGTDLTMSGTLALNTGASAYNFTVGAHTLTLNGPSTIVSATAPVPSFVTSSSSNLIFGGSNSSVKIPASVSQLNNLTNGNTNASGVTMQSSITVNGALSLQSGKLLVGTNVLTLNGSVSTTGGALTSAATGLVDYAQTSNGQNVLSLNYGSLTFSDFNKTLPTSIGIAGTFTPGAAAGHTIPVGSTINYNGTTAQTIAAFNYSNLTSSSSGARTLTSTGTINISRVFTPGTNTYTVGTSTINFNGGVGVTQTIPAAFTYYNLSATIGGTKTLGNNVAVSNDFTIGSGATLSVSGSNYGLTVGGNWANSGTFTAGAGTVTFNKAGTQTISGSGNANFYNLTKSTASTLTLSSAQNLTNILTLTSGGTFNSSGFLTLISNSSGTARIGSLTGVTFNGNLTVQRYIPGAARAYRFLGSPTQTFNLNQLKDNIFITGPTAAGFDANTLQTPSAHTLDASTNAWVPITSLTTTLTTGTGFRIFVRGTRSQTSSLTDESVVPNPVTLDFTGAIQKGNITLPTSSAGQRFNLVGNPYPCTIDWNAAGWTKTNIDNAVYVWKPAGNNTGVYATYINGVALLGGSRYIPSSQGFIVHVTTAAASTLTVTEAAKVTAQDPTVGFRTADDETEGLKISLSDGQDGYTDEALIRFAPGATRLFDRSLDAFKLDNPGNDTNPNGLNISSWVDEATNLAVNTLPELVKNDTIPLRITAFSSGKHQFEFSGLESFAPESDIFLYDSFTHTSTNIKFNPTYSFTVNTADVTTFGNGRFKLIFTLNTEGASNTLVNVKTYPNPNNGYFKMEISNPETESVNWEICDALGRIVTERAYTAPQQKIVEVVNLTSGAGMYFLKVRVGKQVVNRKLVVQ